MTKYMTEEKQKLETHYRNNKKMHYLIQQNTEMKKQIAELEDKYKIYNTKSQMALNFCGKQIEGKKVYPS